jgi:hypothetical protein
VWGKGSSWTNIHDGAGTDANTSNAWIEIGIYRGFEPNYWMSIKRGIIMFNTSSLPDNAIITNAKLSVYIPGTDFHPDGGIKNGMGMSNSQAALSLMNVNPASTNNTTPSDYKTFGTTRYASDIPHNELMENQWNTFTLNSDGKTSISKTSISKLGIRFASDTDNVPPTWRSPRDNRYTNASWIYLYTADKGTSYRPKLEVSYGLDIGLCYRKGNNTYKILCCPVTSKHKLRIRKNGITYGIEIVDITHPDASPIRIYDNDKIKALRKVPM